MKVLGLLCVLFGASYAATTVEILAGDSKFSTLVDLVKKAGLVDALNTGTFTIFAPTDDVFNKVPNATMTALCNDVKALANVLKYHVLQGSVMSSDALNELQVATSNGQKARFNIYTHKNETIVTIQGAQITKFDRMASNGVIHVLGDVMMPPEGDIVDLVSKHSDFSTLFSLVQQAGIASVLKGDSLTLFAPSNAAFSNLLASTVNRLTTDMTLLTEILEYHVVPHTEYSKGWRGKESLKTLDKRNARIVIHASSTDVRIGRNGNVIKADMGTTNGVVHEIDYVLLPRKYY